MFIERHGARRDSGKRRILDSDLTDDTLKRSEGGIILKINDQEDGYGSRYNYEITLWWHDIRAIMDEVIPTEDYMDNDD